MKNFIIVGTQRTGSSALGEAIGLHPNIACGWEWTQRMPRWRQLEVASQALKGEFSSLLPHHKEYMESIYSNEIEWLGFRRLFGASNIWLKHPRYSVVAWRDNFKNHLEWFRQQNNLHILHIVRKNNIDWLKSKFVASKAKSFIGQPYPEGLKVEIPLREAIARVQAKQWIDMSLSKLNGIIPYQQIVYEDMLADQDAVIAKSLNFLQCNPSIMDSKEREVKRQSVKPASDYISNYEDLVSALSNSDLSGEV